LVVCRGQCTPTMIPSIRQCHLRFAKQSGPLFALPTMGPLRSVKFKQLLAFFAKGSLYTQRKKHTVNPCRFKTSVESFFQMVPALQ
jgi:hypothetical protein